MTRSNAGSRFVARHRRLIGILFTHLIVACSHNDKAVEAAIFIGRVVEIHDVAGAPALPAYSPMPPTPENIARVRRGFIARGQKPPTDDEIRKAIGAVVPSHSGAPAEPDHNLFVVETAKKEKHYVRSTNFFAVGACVEVRSQLADRAKNSWLLGEATVHLSASCPNQRDR